MFVTNSSTMNHPPSYIIASASAPVIAIDQTTSTTNNATSQTLSDIKLICTQRKKRNKRHIYLTFVESRSLSSINETPCIEILGKSSSSTSQPTTYSLNECITFEYFDTVKNDFQAFIYAYFESYTISIFFSEEHAEKKSLIIKHLEYMYQSKTEKSAEMNNNSLQDPTQSASSASQQHQQTPILPCASTTEQILHTFDVTLIPYGPIIYREHTLVGPARLYFTTTDLYIASISCNRADLKVTITNQCPSKDQAVLCIPYFTIKNYGNRSNIFLIELGKSNYGNGEVHMKCHSSTLASTIHLLVSPVIEERPLILSSAFQNQLLTHKRIEKSKNIHPPIQLTTDTTNQSVLETSLTLIKKKGMENTPVDSRTTSSTPNEVKSRLVVGFFRALTKNVSHLRRSATFHSNNNHHPNSNDHEQQLMRDNNLTKTKYTGFNMDETKLHNDQHHIILPGSQKKADSISSTSSNLTKQTSETMLTSTLTISTAKPESIMGMYIDMGPTVPKTNQDQQEEIEDEISAQETTATAEIGVNTTISLSPHVRSAIIVGNSVHLIVDEKTLFPIGQRSFTSPASVMQPFKTQLNRSVTTNPCTASSDVMTSTPNSSNSLHQGNSVSNSQQPLLLSYGIVTFDNNDLISIDQTERATSPPPEGSILDRRLNSDISVRSSEQLQGSIAHPLDSVLSSSSAHIFRTLSVSANNIGDSNSGQIIFIDDHLKDQTATYLLGPLPVVSNEPIPTNPSRLPSFNLTNAISRPHLSHIDEEKTSPHDPYALVEPISHYNAQSTSSIIKTTTPLPTPVKSVNYADLLLPNHSNNNECSDTDDQQQLLTSDDVLSEIHDSEEQERESTELSSTRLYTDIDFHQTQRRDRIVQSAAKAKKEDQTPPFVL